MSTLQLQLLLEEQDDVPWNALWYITGEVTYGGRVTDDWDMRCMHSLMRKFYTPDAMEEGYYYTQDKVYRPLPADANYAQVGRYIEGLPVHDNPDLFGMDMNAEKAFLDNQAETLVGTILSVQPRLSGGLIRLVTSKCYELLYYICV